jgi:predicted DNA-binding transcriptional regulator YafY
MNKAAMERATRVPLERIARIHELVSDRKYPTTESLAVDLEVSTRVITDDIAFMRDRWFLPIEFNKEKLGFHYTEPPRKILGFEITNDERLLLWIALKDLEQHRGTPLTGGLQKMLAKLYGEPGDARKAEQELDKAVSFAHIAPEIFHPYTAKMLKTAVKERRGLRFTYREPGATEEKEYAGHPYHARDSNQVWYLMMFLPEEQRIGIFVAHRMRAVVMTEETFQRPPDFDPDEILKGAFLMDLGTEKHEIIVDLDSYAADILRYRKLSHLNGEFIEQPEGRGRVRFCVSSLNAIERWIRYFGLHVTVLEPSVLRERMLKTGQGYVERYGTERGLQAAST